MNLQQYREQIDEIDRQIWKLLEQRMKLSVEIGNYKKARQLPVLDSLREQQIQEEIIQNTAPETAPALCRLYKLLFTISREYQQTLTSSEESRL